MLVPACVLAVVVAGAISGIVSSSPSRPVVWGPATAGVHGASAGAARDHARTLGPVVVTGAVPAPNPSRYQDYEAYLRVRVGGFEALGRRTADATQIVQALGGYVASVDQSTTSGQPGVADIVVRVPVANVQTALVRFSALGTVLDQHVSIRDLNAVVRAQRERILQLRVEVARIAAALQQSLPADERVRLQLQLDQARRDLQQATGANGGTLRTAALSRVELTLTTERPAVVIHHSGRASRAVHAAVGFLAGAGMVALAGLIILSPIAALVALAIFGVRAYRRWEERRLLAAS